MKKDIFSVIGPSIQEGWDEIDEIIVTWADKVIEYIEEESEKLGISFNAASKIVYLRLKNWTKEKEAELIRLDQEGKELPYVFDGCF